VKYKDENKCNMELNGYGHSVELTKWLKFYLVRCFFKRVWKSFTLGCSEILFPGWNSWLQVYNGEQMLSSV
jgi:hypothetical protein